MTVSGLRNSNGFTLIEIIVALVILTIALLGLISTTVMVVKGNSFSKTMTTATTLAKDKLEELKSTNYASLSAGSTTDYAKADSTQQGTQTAESMYTRTWTINSNSPATDMKTVEVNVQWNWQNVAHNVDIRSIVAK